MMKINAYPFSQNSLLVNLSMETTYFMKHLTAKVEDEEEKEEMGGLGLRRKGSKGMNKKKGK